VFWFGGYDRWGRRFAACQLVIKPVEFLGICDNRLALATEWNIFLFNKIAGTALRNFEIVSELLYAS
jgi:hypothetical protein